MIAKSIEELRAREGYNQTQLAKKQASHVKLYLSLKEMTFTPSILTAIK